MRAHYASKGQLCLAGTPRRKAWPTALLRLQPTCRCRFQGSDKLPGTQRPSGVRTLANRAQVPIVLRGAEVFTPGCSRPAPTPGFHIEAGIHVRASAMRSRARPLPTFRVAREARSHRIPFRVAQRDP